MQVGTFDEQVQFISFEMLQGSERPAGSHLRAASDARQAGIVVSMLYERPNDPNGSVANHRGERAAVWSGLLT